MKVFLLLLVFHLPTIIFSQDITLLSGKYEITVSPTLAWTIRCISYDGIVMGKSKPSQYYGTVMATEPGKYIGAGHTEGGKEIVKKIRLNYDSRSIEPKSGEKYIAEKLTLYKISLFDKLLFQTKIELSQNGLIEQKRFMALENQKIDLLYINLFCWITTTTDWCAMTVGGQNLSGTFDKNYSAESRWNLKKDVRWAGIYESAKNCAILVAYPQPIKTKGIKSAFWHVRDCYNKYYLQVDIPPVCPQGYVSPVYTTLLRGFIAVPAQWQFDAQIFAEKMLMENVPFLDNFEMPEN